MPPAKTETFRDERAYETLVENASEIIARFDRDRRHLYVNRAVTRATGLPSSAFIGKTNAEMGMPPDLVATWDALIDRVFDQATEETTEFSFVAPDGAVRWFRSRLVPETGVDGTVESVLVVARDITDHRAEEERRLDEAHRQRQRAEDALSERTALLQAISDTSLDPIYVKDVDGRITFANPATLRLIGLPAAEVLGRTDAAFLADGDVARQIMANDQRVMRTGVPEEFEERVPYPDGTECLWLSRKIPFRDGHGRVVGLLGISRDITDRKRAEQAVREAHAALERILASITDGLTVLDREWRYTYFNETGARILELHELDPVGRTVWELFPHADQLLFGREYRKAMATGVPTHFEEYYPAPLNKWIECHCYPSEEGLSVYFRDVTERNAAEAERDALLQAEKRSRVLAEQATEAKDRLLAAVSHELRNPLTTLWGWLQLMEMSHDEETRALALHSMRASVKAQKRLVDDLLDSVGLARGTVVFSAEVVDLAEVATEIVQTLQPSAAASGIDLHARCTRAVHVLGDRARLAQAVVNLLSNALKFTPRDGTISVTVDQHGDTAVLQVSDTGYGIGPEFLPRIFERFTQERAHSAQGLGLGLSIVQEIVQRLGGRISAASAGEGKGTQFTIELPLQSAPPQAVTILQ